MKTAHLRRTAWFPLVLLWTCPDRASGVINHFTEFAQNCGVTAVVTSARVFSQNDENRWGEYPNAKQLPKNAERHETAYVWAKPDSPVLIGVLDAGEDFARKTYYCFGASGKLSSLEHEVRTAQGWSFAEHRDLYSDGKETIKSHFFNTEDRKEIPRPPGASDIRAAMTVKIYRKLQDLPFFLLLTRRPKSK